LAVNLGNCTSTLTYRSPNCSDLPPRRSAARTSIWHAFAAQAEGAAVLGLGRDTEYDTTLHRRNLDLAAQEHGVEIYGGGGVEVVTLALEARIGQDRDTKDHVAEIGASGPTPPTRTRVPVLAPAGILISTRRRSLPSCCDEGGPG